jgi:rod shape determining protein RodA
MVLVGYTTLYSITAGLITLTVLIVIIFFFQRQRRMVWIGLAVGLLVMVGVEVGMEQVLRPHQKARIEAFVNPESDPQGAGWNVLQAKTAIGSGGITGKGFLQGTQTQLRFLPEQWTDFIFCVIGEEFGFLGSGLVVTLFILLFLNLISMATTHNHPFAQLFMVGVLGVFFFHFLINIGSAMGLLPVIGLPLPFISYGGSSFLANSMLIAIVLNLNLYERLFSIYR